MIAMISPEGGTQIEAAKTKSRNLSARAGVEPMLCL